MALQPATEHRFPITPQMAHWKCSRAAGDAHDALQQLEALYWESLRSVRGTVCANKSCGCGEEGEIAFRAEASVPGLQRYCHPRKFQLN